MNGRRKRFFTAAAALAMGGLALLIWAKLRMVAGVPRTALADPKLTAPTPPRPAPRPQAGPPAADTDDRRDFIGD